MVVAQPPYELARRQGGVLRLSDLTDSGLTKRMVAVRLDRGELVRVTPGLYRLSGAPTTWHQRIWEAILAADHGAVASHRTAARLHRLGSFRTEYIDIVQVGNPQRRPSTPDRHRSLILPDHHLTEVDGIPATTVERTIFDLAGQVSLKRRERGWPYLNERTVERILDDALARGLDISKMDRVLAEIGGRGRGGTALMRRLLEQRGHGFVATESELEDAVDAVVRSSGLPIPVRQRNLGGLEEPIGRVDLLIVKYRVVIEADGRRHHIALIDKERDSWRDLELSAAGFLVVRVTWRQIKQEPGRFIRNLERVLRLRGWEPDMEMA